MLKLLKKNFKKAVVLLMSILMATVAGCAGENQNTTSKPSETNSQVSSTHPSSDTSEERITMLPTVIYSDAADSTEKNNSGDKQTDDYIPEDDKPDDKTEGKDDKTEEKDENADWKPGTPPESGATVSESPLSNTYKFLTQEKKLTIGYLGGSITLGSSANKVIDNGRVISQTGGDIMGSWVNRVSTWFKEEYPDAKIETVNAGISDTATNLGLFRLKSTLMNTDGHDMPDLIFVEFTNNDWFYAPYQDAADLKIQIESLFKNIWQLNPYAEIIVISTNRYKGNQSTAAYEQVCKHYGIPMIDVGTKLAELIISKNGTNYETSGTLYYTTDDLHPSTAGYLEYFNVIKPKLSEYLKFTLQSKKVFNYKDAVPTPLSGNLIDSPTMLTVDDLKYSGNVSVVSQPLGFSMFGTNTQNLSSVTTVDKHLKVSTGGKITATFKGSCLGVFVKMTTSDMEFKYKIDDGEWKNFGVNDSRLSFQKYTHSQVFMLEHDLSDTEHTLQIEFTSKEAQFFGALLVNG